MARIVFISGAYLGDVAPFVEPANRLAACGHEVTFVLPVGFHPLLGNEAFDLVPYPLDFSPSGMGSDPMHERLLRHPVANQVRLARYWTRRGFVDGPDITRDALLHVLDDADVLVTHPTLGAASMPVAQHLGVPVVVGQLFPMMMPTSAWAPPTGTRNLDLRRPINTIAWKSFAWGSGPVMYDRTFNRHRRELGQAPLHGNPLLAWTRAERTVVLLSRHYFGPRARRLAGVAARWVLALDRPKEPGGGSTDRGVPRRGRSPRCWSASAPRRPRVPRRRSRRSRRASVEPRCDPSCSWAAPPTSSSWTASTGTFEFAPVADVAARCVAAVVSGAVGTLAAALTAGLPVVVLPQLFDQIWHGRRVEELGVGILVTRPDKVSGAVARLLRDPRYLQRARQLADSLRSEDGAGSLVAAVEATI